MSARSGKRLTSAQRKRSRELRNKFRLRVENMYDSRVPPGFMELHRVVTGIIREKLRTAKRSQAILIHPIEYTDGLVTVTISVDDKDGMRSLLQALTFNGDYTHPEFLTHLDKFLSNCVVLAGV